MRRCRISSRCASTWWTCASGLIREPEARVMVLLLGPGEAGGSVRL